MGYKKISQKLFRLPEGRGQRRVFVARFRSTRDPLRTKDNISHPPYPGCLRSLAPSPLEPRESRRSRKRAIAPIKDAAESLPGKTPKKSEDRYFSRRSSPSAPGIPPAILLRFHPFNFLPRRSLGNSPRGCFYRRALLHPFARGIALIEMCMYIIYI